MANGWAPFIGLIVVAAFMAGAWFLSPKGENQTIWRSTLMLSAASMYLMWCMWSLPFLAIIISEKKERMNVCMLTVGFGTQA
jgi:V-type H+-transporting ATPase subunit e